MEKVECQSPLASKMSSAQLRKIKKPIIEKRRRERINDSLNQLKSLVLDAMQKDESRYSKMEKADILEMTVHHLKHLTRQQSQTQSDSHNLGNKYTAGYSECANEVAQFLHSTDGLAPEVQLRVMSHLSQGVQNSASRVTAANIQTPTPIMATPAYHGATLPCATPISALPGSTEASYPASISPLSLITSPVSLPSGVLLIQPRQMSPMSDGSLSPMSSSCSPSHSPSAYSSPAHSPSSVGSHSPSSVSGAIPLYANSRYSPVSPPEVQRSSSRQTTSPSVGDDFPSRFAEESHTIRDTVIAKTHNKNNNNNIMSSCKNQARLAYHMDEMVSMAGGSMWRPW